MQNLRSYLKLLRKESKHFPSASFWKMIKYYRPWIRSFQTTNKIADIPWMTFGAIDFLNANSNSEMKVFEFGSGSSTIFWAKKVKEVFSVEHDEEWSKNISKELEERHLLNVHLFLVKPQKFLTAENISISDPYKYATDDDTYREFSFEKYVKKIEVYPDNYFDYVVVDGRARPSCIAASLSKIKCGGYLVVDNSERAYYFTETLRLLPADKWQRKDFSGPVPGLTHFHQTSIFKKS